MKKLFYLIIFFISFSLSSTEVFILRPKVSGNIPKNLRNLEDLSFEFQKIVQFYLHYFYKFSLNLQLKSNHIVQKSQYRRICFNRGVDYIVYDRFFFDDLLIFTRNLFDCRKNQLKEVSQTFKGDLFSAIKEINDISFLNLYKKQNIIEVFSKEKAGSLYILLHNSLSFQKELKQVVDFISNKNFTPIVKFLVIEKNKYRLSSNQKNLNSLLDFSNAITSPTSKELFEATYRLNPYIENKDKIVIFTNAKVQNINQNYLSHFNFFPKNLVYLVLGNYYGVQSYSLHKSFVRNYLNVNYFDISYYRKVVLPENSFYLIKKGDKLYQRKNMQDNLAFFDNLKKTDLHIYKSNLRNLTPLNFTYNYEKISQKKIIAAYDLNNNLNLILRKIFRKYRKTSYVNSRYKYLIKTNLSTFWFFSNEVYKLNSFVSLKTVYERASNIRFRNRNNPTKTNYYNLPISRLLICDRKKVDRYFKNTNSKTFECILKGKIIDRNEL